MRVVISHLSTCLFQIIFSTDRFIYLYYLKIVHSCTEVDDAVVGYTLGGILGFYTCVPTVRDALTDHRRERHLPRKEMMRRVRITVSYPI